MDQEKIHRIAVFSGDVSFSVRKGLVALADEFPHVSWLVVEARPKKPISRLLRNQWRNLRKNGWRWIPYQLTDIVSRLASRFKSDNPRLPNRPGTQYELDALINRPGFSYLRVGNMHGEDVIKAVREFSPDLGLSLAAPILKPVLFAIPKLGTINLHKGKLPYYRGMPPAFWELFNGEKEVGCSVHKVLEGLDTGPLLVESSVSVERWSTVKGLQLQLDELGVKLMVEAVRLLHTGTEEWKPQAQGGRTFSKPTLGQEKELAARLPCARQDSPLRCGLKSVLFWTYIHLIRPLPRRLLAMANRQRVVVILYHRVNDNLRDSLTIGLEKFDQQMAWIASHCTVVSIESVVAGKLPRDSRRPVVAVTFDDGYLDNFKNAVPILLRHQVPAGFFVSTGIVNTDSGFDHDNRTGKLPTMTWDNLRVMKSLGFTIGSHTVSHLDCGHADASLVEQELLQSRRHLHEELGIEQVILAYPFGGRQNMTPEALNIVRKTGYIGCLAAYGGVNNNAIDSFNILRTGVDHNFTMLAFRARLEGLK